MSKMFQSLFEGLANAAATRNYLSAATGAATLLVVLGSISQDQAHSLVQAMQQFMDGLGQMIGAGKNIVLILGPVVVGVCAKYAGFSATLKGRLTAITADPNVRIDGKIIAPPDVAAQVPSVQVIGKSVTGLIVLLAVGAAFSLLLANPASAQIKRLSLPTPQQASSNLAAVLDKLAAKGTADLQAADDLAAATDDKGNVADPIAHACYPALIKFVGGLPKPATDGSMPGPAVIYERARIARKMVQGGLPEYLVIGCAPLVQDSANFVVKILAIAGVAVGTGGLSIPAIPGLLPALPILP